MSTTPKQLPLLDYTAKLFTQDRLKDTYLIGCQHVLPSLYYLLKSAMQLGLPAENISMIGKCYSSSKIAYKMIRDESIFVSDQSFAYDSHTAFDDQFKGYIDVFLKERLEKIDDLENKRIIILDDGGEVLNAANKYLRGHPNLLGVEQTSSGYNKLCNEEIHFPIINVARSYAKLNFESPHIAFSILAQLNKTIHHKNKNILIIGKGAIGSALENYLRAYAHIDFYDYKFHDAILDSVDLGKYDIIIGATGNKVFDPDIYPYLKNNVHLVSVSSSDREFSAVNLRNKTYKNTDCHKTLAVNNINLVNSGFPLNFYGSNYDNVPLRDIQLTFSLLLAGVCQDKPSTQGFVELDHNVQALILERFQGLQSNLKANSYL